MPSMILRLCEGISRISISEVSPQDFIQKRNAKKI